MDQDLNAFSTDDPATVAAWRDGLDDQRSFTKILFDAVRQLGFVTTTTIPYRHGVFGGSDSIVALYQEGDVVPEGWRKVRGRLEPRRGKPGEPARQWLAAHQPPDVRQKMTQFGLPRTSWVERKDNFGYRVCSPEIFEHDGVLWACYEGKPGDRNTGFDDQECTWTPRKLSEFYAAKEAFQADQPDHENGDDDPEDGPTSRD